MEQELNTLREKFVQDLFVSQGLGAVIDEAHYGYAKCSMEIEPRHCNALGIPMGGTIFTPISGAGLWSPRPRRSPS